MKRIRMRNKIGLGLLAGIGAGLSLLTLAPTAKAQTATYASSRRQVKACILIASKDAPLFPPYAFYELDSRTDIKPGAWDIINPLAPATVSGAGYQRWKGNASASTDGSFQLNAPLAKNMAPYWEADLSVISDDDLRKMDIVALPITSNGSATYTMNLTDVELQRLRRFVDGGGLLWIEGDPNNGAQSYITNFLFGWPGGAGAGSARASQYHPLLNFPNKLSDFDLSQIAGPGSGAYSFKLTDPDARYMYPLVMGAGITIAAGDYGAGHIVLSEARMALNINSEITKNGQNLRSNPRYDSALKFVANMIAWTSSAPTQGGNARRTNSTGERVGSQLGEKWTWTNTGSTIGVGSGAVIYKGLVFYVDSSNVLHAFDRDPSQTLLGGSADDGIPDFLSLGTPYDEVFSVNTKLSGRVSTPTVASTINGDYVAVTNDSGITKIYSFSGGGFIGIGEFDGAGSGQIPAGVPIPSPVYSEGLFFAVTTAQSNKTDGVWRVVPLDPSQKSLNAFGSNIAVAPFADNSATPSKALEGLPTLTGPISVGYIKDAATGALDKIIYCPTVPLSVGGNPGNNPASLIGALWFNTKNEPLDPFVIASGSNLAFRPQGARANVPWHLGAAGDPLNPVLHLTHRVTNADGSVTETHSTLTYPGQFKVYMGGLTLASDPNNAAGKSATTRETEILLTTAIADGDELHADYTLNWLGNDLTDGSGNSVPMTGGLTGDMAKITRLFVTAVPNLQNNPTRSDILGGAALSSQDLAIFNTVFNGGLNGNTGRIYGLREQYGAGTVVGNGNRVSKGIGTQVAWAFSPEPSRGTIASRPSRLQNSDPYTSAGTGAYYTNFIPVGSPAISNDTVYVVGTATSSYTGPGQTIVMALRANPSMTITLGASTGIPQPLPIGWEFRIFNRPEQQGDTDWFNQAPHLTRDAQFTVDPDSGNITIFDCRLSDGNVLNLGEPIVIGVKPTQVQGKTGIVTPPPIVVILPNPNDASAISPLDNLAWFMVLPKTDNQVRFLPQKLWGLTPTSGPAVIGDTLYYASVKGVVSVDLRGFGSQHYVHINNPIVKGAVNSADISESNLRVHLLTPPVAFAGMLEPPTGTERTLVMGLPGGLSAFDSRPTLISDGTRLLEVDYGGNALWTMDATLAYVFDSAGNSVTTKTNLARPGVAHRIGLDQFFFADTNNNRVTLADRGGKTLWEMTSFNNDMGFIPPGYPLTLNAPTDVEVHQDTYTSLTFASPKGKFTYNDSTKPVAVNRYLIADSGNFRLLEIVDVLDATTGNPISINGVPMQRQVSFVSKSLGEQNLKHRYRTIQEFAVPNAKGNPDLYIVAAIANTARGTTGGSVSVLTASGNNQEGLGGSVEVLHRDLIDSTQDGKTFAVFTSLILPKSIVNGKAVGGQYIPLNNVTFCKGFYNAAADPGAAYPLNQFSYQYMIADQNGCYVVNSDGVILWMLSSAQYFSMTGRPLNASSIQRLTQADLNPNGGDSRPWYPRFLITNRYEGPDSLPEQFPGLAAGRGQIHGEVFEIRSLDYERSGGNGGVIYQNVSGGIQLVLGGMATPITWLFPNEKQVVFYPTDPNYPTQPIFSIERTVGNPDNATSTSLLQQPTHAERPN